MSSASAAGLIAHSGCLVAWNERSGRHHPCRLQLAATDCGLLGRLGLARLAASFESCPLSQRRGWDQDRWGRSRIVMPRPTTLLDLPHHLAGNSRSLGAKVFCHFPEHDVTIRVENLDRNDVLAIS